MWGKETRVRAVFLVATLGVLVIALLGGHFLMWHLLYLLLLLLGTGFAWVRLGLRGLEGGLSQGTAYCQVGGSFREEAVVRNHSLLPKLLVRAWQPTDLPGFTNRRALSLAPRRAHHWQAEVRCTRRGRYRLGPLLLETGDPFGLFAARRELGGGGSLLVYPPTADLSFVPFLSYGAAGARRDQWLTRGPRGVFARLREYAPGDNLSQVHWPSTAHAGRLMVRDFSQDTSRNTWLVLDMQREAAATATQVEQRIVVATSLIKKYLDGGRRVGLLTEGDAFHLVTPAVGETQFWRLMEALAVVQAEGRVGVPELLEREGWHFGGNSLLVVITASVSGRLAQCLLKLQNQGITAALMLPESERSPSPSRCDIAHYLATNGIPTYFVKGARAEGGDTPGLPLYLAVES